jgi:hypothetical protein
MKRGAGLGLLLFVYCCFGQNERAPERQGQDMVSAQPSLLAKQLTAGYESEKDKVRAIFNWITDNIAYRLRTRYTGTKRSEAGVGGNDADAGAWKSANEMVAETVLRNRSAVCDGYARLFTTLCNYAGIRSALVTGYARSNFNRQNNRFLSNHTWNAVFIDSAWYLLDATWASGYTSYFGNEFVKQYDGYYFLTPTLLFIRDHFPDELRWTLMDNPPALSEFEKAPYRQRAYAKYHFTGFQPGRGIIEVSPGDTVRIILHTSDPAGDKTIAEDSSALDTAAVTDRLLFIDNVYPAEENKNGEIVYYYRVVSPEASWLQVIYNNDIVLRYKLKQRKDKAGTFMN